MPVNKEFWNMKFEPRLCLFCEAASIIPLKKPLMMNSEKQFDPNWLHDMIIYSMMRMYLLKSTEKTSFINDWPLVQGLVQSSEAAVCL